MSTPTSTATSRQVHFSESFDEGFLKSISFKMEAAMESPLGEAVKPAMAVLFMLNSLTGTSMLTLPYAFTQSGLVLGSLVLLVCGFLGYVTVTYACESLSIANALHYEEAEEALLREDKALRAHIHEEAAALGDAHRNSVEDLEEELRMLQPLREFKIRERVELGALGEQVLHNKAISTLIYGVILVMTYGNNSVVAVLINQSLAHTVSSLLSSAGYSTTPADLYPFCVVSVFLLELPLCLSDLQKTKRFTQAVMALKFTAIVLLTIVSLVIAGRHLSHASAYEELRNIPLWRMDGFSGAFSNSVFLFAIHHLIPSIAGPIQPQYRAPGSIGCAFCIICIFIIVVNASALVAWQSETHATCSTKIGGHYCRIMPVYNLNFEPVPWLGGSIALFIVTYPAMGIANLPATCITTRNTLGKVLGLRPPDPKRPLTLINVLMVLVVLVPPFIVALITQDVQAVIKYVGGYAGLTVVYVIPLVLVVKGRRLLHLNEEMADCMDRPLKSRFANSVGYATVVAFFMSALVVVTKTLFFA